MNIYTNLLKEDVLKNEVAKKLPQLSSNCGHRIIHLVTQLTMMTLLLPSTAAGLSCL